MAESQKKGTGFKKFFKFKGLGNLNSLPWASAFRRVSVVPSSRELPRRGLLSSNGFLDPAFRSSQNDLKAMPKSPSVYARSCDMYSHMGTYPRASSRGVKKKPKDQAKGPKEVEAHDDRSPSSGPDPSMAAGTSVPKQEEKGPPGKTSQSPNCSKNLDPIVVKTTSECFLEMRKTSVGLKEEPKRSQLDLLRASNKPGFGSLGDDLNAMPKSPSPCARSSDMYSHMGTMPRESSRQARKKLKGKAKGDTEGNAREVVSSAPGPMPSVISEPSVAQKDLLSGGGKEEQTEGKSPPGEDSQSPNTSEIQDSIVVKSSSESLPKFKRSSEGSKEKPKRNQRDPLPIPSKPTFGSMGDDLNTVARYPSPYARLCDMSSHLGTLPRSRTGHLGEAAKEKSTKQQLDSGLFAGDVIQEHNHVQAFRAPAEPGEQAANGEENSDQQLGERHQDRLGSCSEYVKFSKEKYILDSSPEKLHKELEEELKLSSRDLRSHAWYHGRIPREVSESLVQRNGDFLIRDSLTSLGDYVLTCRWRNEPLHFKINKVLVKSSDGRTHVQFLFEQDSFDNVPALVRFYVGNRKPVSEQSGAVFYCPINRTFPLRYLEASYGLANGKLSTAQAPSNQKGTHIKRRSITMTDGLTADKIIRGEGCPTSVSLPHHGDIIRNCTVSVEQIQDLHVSMTPISETYVAPAYTIVSRLKPHADQAANGIAPGSPVIRRSSEPQLCQGNGGRADLSSNSTHSTPSHGYSRASPSPSVGSYSDSDTGHYCQLHPPSPVQWDRPNGDGKPTPAKSYVERLKGDENQRGIGPNGGKAEAGPTKRPSQDLTDFAVPVVETTSSFNPAVFHSPLIPLENKPLEMAVLKKVKELLAEADAKMLAKHITRVDCLVARILGVTKETQRLMGVSSGMELLTLPHGHQLRMDLLERFHTMTIMIAVDILGCTGSMEERASLLHKTIQLAAELKSTMGNMFSFAAVMNALEMTQISRLEQTWMVLRQRHTEGAILYEKKLKPFLKSLNEGSEGPPLSNTTFPHILPLITLLERDTALPENPEPWENMESGVEIVMVHLEAARTVAHHGGLYQTNAEVKLQGFQPQPELLEVFNTEFQLRLLWGSRGAESGQSERYERFNKVLTALSHKLEPAVRSSEL